MFYFLISLRFSLSFFCVTIILFCFFSIFMSIMQWQKAKLWVCFCALHLQRRRSRCKKENIRICPMFSARRSPTYSSDQQWVRRRVKWRWEKGKDTCWLSQIIVFQVLLCIHVVFLLCVSQEFLCRYHHFLRASSSFISERDFNLFYSKDWSAAEFSGWYQQVERWRCQASECGKQHELVFRRI